MSTILVTGAAGFIGSWVAEALAHRGDRVIGVDNFTPYYDVNLKRARAKRHESLFNVIEADISDREAMRRLFQESAIDKVCHLAAQAGVRYSIEKPFAYETANNLGTLTLLEACREKGVKTFVYASSSSVYGGNKKVPFSESDNVDTPISLYAATKKYNELLAHTYSHLFGIHTTGLRFFTVYGPWGRPDMALFKFTRGILAGEPIDVYNDGKMKRDFTFITDIVAGVVASLDLNARCEVFNLGNSKTEDLLHFVECVEKELGKPAKKNFLPMQPGDVPETFADIMKARKMLGFSPQVNIAEGIKRFIQWYRSYYKSS